MPNWNANAAAAAASNASLGGSKGTTGSTVRVVSPEARGSMNIATAR
jgi:hypothetical protein